MISCYQHFFFLSVGQKSAWKMGKTDGCCAEKPWKCVTEGFDALKTPKGLKDVALPYKLQRPTSVTYFPSSGFIYLLNW